MIRLLVYKVFVQRSDVSNKSYISFEFILIVYKSEQQQFYISIFLQKINLSRGHTYLCNLNNTILILSLVILSQKMRNVHPSSLIQCRLLVWIISKPLRIWDTSFTRSMAYTDIEVRNDNVPHLSDELWFW